MMNSFAVTIRFQFADEELTAQLVDVLKQAPDQSAVDLASCTGAGTGFAGSDIQLSLNGMAFDEVVVPFPECEFADDDGQTDLLLSFSTRDQSEIRSLILELVDSVIRAN